MEKIKIDPKIIKGKQRNLIIASFIESIKKMIMDCNENEMVKLPLEELNAGGLKAVQSLRNYTGAKDFIPGHKVRITFKSGNIYLYKIKI